MLNKPQTKQGNNTRIHPIKLLITTYINKIFKTSRRHIKYREKYENNRNRDL